MSVNEVESVLVGSERKALLSDGVSLQSQSTLHSKDLSLKFLSCHCHYSFDCIVAYNNYLLFFIK